MNHLPGPPPWNPAGRHAGFTLIEVMIASGLVLVTVLAVTAIWAYAAQVLDGMLATVRLNQEVRLIAGLLREGGDHVREATTTPILPLTFQEPAGVLHASGNATTLTTGNAATMTLGRSPTRVRVWNNRLALVHNGSDPATDPTLLSSAFSLPVQCRGAGVPHPDCTGTESRRVGGLVSVVTFDSTRSVARRTMEVSVSLVDPTLANRPEALPEEYQDSFRLVVPINYTPVP